MRADPAEVERERGDIVLGWLTKLVVALSLVGVVGFDAISLGATRFQAEDHAQQAARAAAAAWDGPLDLQKAYDAAVAEVADDGDTIDAPSFSVAPDGAVTLTLVREVPTLLVDKVASRVEALEDWTVARRTVTARPPS